MSRFFAVLLIITTIPLLLNILTLPTIVIFGVFALFLFFGKKYHLITNIIFLLLAAGIYFIPLPIGCGLFLAMREIRFEFNWMKFIFCLPLILFVSLAIRNMIGRQRNFWYFISVLIIIVIILAYPLLAKKQLRHRAMEDDMADSLLTHTLVKQEMKIKPGASGSSSTALSRDYTANFDESTQKYTYRLNLTDPLEKSIVFTTIKLDGEKINFKIDNRINCPHCQIGRNNSDTLIFPAGGDIDFIITSDEFIETIEFTESDGKIAYFVFWK